MRTRNDNFHLSADKYIANCEKLYRNALSSGFITKDDETAIRAFIAHLAGTLSGCRTYKLVDTFILCREFYPPYMECTTQDVQNGINKIVFARDNGGNQRFTQNTQNDRGKIMRRFFLWLLDEVERAKVATAEGEHHWMHTIESRPKLNERDIKKLTPPKPNKMTKTRADMLTEEEIKKLVESAHSIRDKAMISVLYESGCRVMELGSLCWSQISFTEWGVILNVDGKTEIPRHIPLMVSKPYLIKLRENSRNSTDSSGYVFVQERSTKVNGKFVYKPLTYNAIKKAVLIAAENAGIDKKKCSKLHTFRHSRVTNLITQGCKESSVKRLIWNNLNTREFATYCHLVSEDVDRDVAGLYGVNIDGNTDGRVHPTFDLQQCNHCHQMNSPTSKYCEHCGLPLVPEAENAVERGRRELEELFENESDSRAIREILTEWKKQKNNVGN